MIKYNSTPIIIKDEFDITFTFLHIYIYTSNLTDFLIRYINLKIHNKPYMVKQFIILYGKSHFFERQAKLFKYIYRILIFIYFILEILVSVKYK
jgi:hypothetical protein